MKKYLFLMVAVVLAGCADQTLVENVAGEKAELALVSEVNALKEKARWGDGQAYLKLADCYRDGKGVKKDFVGMLCMATLASDYSDFNQMDAYLETIPEDSEYKLLVDCIHLFEQNKMEEALPLIERAIANGSPDGYALKGVTVLEHGDSLEAKRLFELAAEKGSSLAELLLCLSGGSRDMNPNTEKLAALTEKIPWVYNILAGEYASKNDDASAAYYYLKADREACLTRRGAMWLWGYMDYGADLNLSPTDKERIQILADIDLIEIVDTVDVQ